MGEESEEKLLEAVGRGLPLRCYEEKMVRAVHAGRTVKLENAKVRSKVVRRLCMHADAVAGGQPGRICIKGGGLLEDLDLTGLNLDFGLKLVGTDLQRLVLDDTRLLALELIGGSAREISADRIEVAHDIVINDGFSCHGRLTLRSASVGGDLNCDGSHFSRADGTAIMLDGTRIGGRLFMRPSKGFPFQASGDVRGRNMRVAGGMICTGGKFERGLSLTRTQVLGDLRLNKADIGSVPSEAGKPPDAELLLGAMHITGQLSLDKTDYHGPEVVLKHTRVEGRLRWKLIRTEPKVEDLEVDLMQARVGYLDDDLESWHEARMKLDGFSFEGVAVDGKDWKSRKQWLASQRTGKWSPYPYSQMRTALLNAGDESAARKITVARERERLRQGRLGPLKKLAQGAYWLLLGFGYRPLQFFFIAAGIVLLFALAFHGVKHCRPEETVAQCKGFAVPAAHSPTYHSLLFSFDTFTPVDLGQTSAWQVHKVALYSYLVAAEAALGWLLTGLLLGAVTGILRRD